MQRVSDVYKQQKISGGSKQTGKKASEPAVPSGQGIGAAAAPAPPVQQSSAEADEAALRQFDLATKYGPCSGMTRLERYERAVELGLDPPAYVKELVLRHGADSMFNRNLWEHPA